MERPKGKEDRGEEEGMSEERGAAECHCASHSAHCHSQEELQRHTVWMANRQYIEDHNTFNTENTGFTLAMNQFGDLVSSTKCQGNVYVASYVHVLRFILDKNTTC